jgi:hypothetical protein
LTLQLSKEAFLGAPAGVLCRKLLPKLSESVLRGRDAKRLLTQCVECGPESGGGVALRALIQDTNLGLTAPNPVSDQLQKRSKIKLIATVLFVSFVYANPFGCIATPQTVRARELYDKLLKKPQPPPRYVPPPPRDAFPPVSDHTKVVEGLLFFIILNNAAPGAFAIAKIFGYMMDDTVKALSTVTDERECCAMVKTLIEKLKSMVSEEAKMFTSYGFLLLAEECRDDPVAKETLEDMLSPRLWDINPKFLQILRRAAQGSLITREEIDNLRASVKNAQTQLPIFSNGRE